LLALGTLEWRRRGGLTRPLTIRAVRATHDRLLVHFEGFPTREAASVLTNGELWCDAAKLPDPGPGVAYTFQLVGLRVVDVKGGELGILRNVTIHGDRAFYMVEREGRERVLPGHAPFLKRVDIPGGVIEMDLPAGFEDLDA
jgi:16S rRNA processing protein RimM